VSLELCFGSHISSSILKFVFAVGTANETVLLGSHQNNTFKTEKTIISFQSNVVQFYKMNPLKPSGNYMYHLF
jgi:hypothetical protein